MLLDNVIKRSQSLSLTTRAPAPMMSRKQAPFIWPAFRAGAPQWQITDFGSYVADGFNLNTLIYSAIMYKVRSAYYAPLRAYIGDPDHPEALPLDHPLSALCKRPNTYQDSAEFMGLNTVYLNVSGNSFVMLDRPRRGALPTAMYPLRPDRVFIIPGDDKRSLKGYLYVPEGQAIYNGVPILPEDMMHVKLPNPGDPLEGMGYGLSPFSPMARSADVDNAVTHYLKIFFQRGTAINTYLKFDVPMDDATISQVKARFMEIYGGVENWADVGVIDQGGEIKQFGMNFKDMGFAEIDDRNESRVLGPFGVPGILIGTRSGLARAINANAKELRAMFWEDTMLPELGLHEAEYQYYLRGDDGAFPMFETRKIPALQKDKPALATAFTGLVNIGITKNQASAYLDMDFGEIPDGDVVYMPFSLVPIGRNQSPQTVIDETAVPDASQPTKSKALQIKAGFTPEQKAALWKANDRTAAKWEPKFSDAAVRAFDRDMREILAIVNDAKIKAREAKASVNWTASLKSVEDYLAEAGEDNWRSTFAPVMRGVITDQGKRWAADLGMQFDVENLFAQEWFDKYTLKFAQEINGTTKDELSSIFQQAQAEGWSVPEMQKHLKTVFEQWSKGDVTADEFEWYTSRMPAYRTEMIARTETIRSSNAGSQELYDEWGVKEHEWLSTKDDRTRPDHADADGQVQPINEPFDVGGEKLMYPGDPAGSPSNTIQCRCTVLPVIGD